MTQLTKIRLVHMANAFSMLMFIVSNLMMYIQHINFDFVTETGETIHLNMSKWLLRHFILPPVAYVIISGVAMIATIPWYTREYKKIDERIIQEANRKVDEWVKRNWWKVTIGIILFCITTVEIGCRMTGRC